MVHGLHFRSFRATLCNLGENAPKRVNLMADIAQLLSKPASPQTTQHCRSCPRIVSFYREADVPLASGAADRQVFDGSGLVGYGPRRSEFRHIMPGLGWIAERSEEHTSELQSLMRNSYA